MDKYFDTAMGMPFMHENRLLEKKQFAIDFFKPDEHSPKYSQH